jgi:hypothetical protein
MSVSDALKGMRESGYGEKTEEKKEDGPRLIKLTDDEAKELGGQGDGTEMECTVKGRLSGSEFSVISVHGSGGDDQNEMASQVMDKMGNAPTMRPQTMPYPS